MVFQASIKSSAIYEMVTHNNSISRTPPKLRFLGALRALTPVMANVRYLEESACA